VVLLSANGSRSTALPRPAHRHGAIVFTVPARGRCRNVLSTIRQNCDEELRHEWRLPFGRGLRKNKKNPPYPAPLITMLPETVFDFSGCLALLVFGDFPARGPAEPRRCLLLGQDDAPAKRNLDQLRKLAIELFGPPVTGFSCCSAPWCSFMVTLGAKSMSLEC
jgi:hypothetical protein